MKDLLHHAAAGSRCLCVLPLKFGGVVDLFDILLFSKVQK